MPETPPTAEEITRQIVERIRLLRRPAYGLVPESDHRPLSSYHAETLEQLEFEAHARNLKP